MENLWINKQTGRQIKTIDKRTGRQIKTIDKRTGRQIKTIDKRTGRQIKTMDKQTDKGNDHMMTVHELSALAGISVRTLHYYDKIGLLPPADITSAGYRLYDDNSISALQEILLYRELEFPLKEIIKIINDPRFDMNRAIDEQIHLLEIKRDHLSDLIFHAKKLQKREEYKMDFSVYDNTRMEAYKKLAKETWGDTTAYKEYEKKTAGNTEVTDRQNAEDLMKLFNEFGDLMTLSYDDPAVQAQVEKLRSFITDKYYTCTKQILAGLGEMYVAGGEMTANIDVAGGRGCARFVAKAIEFYCKQQ